MKIRKPRAVVKRAQAFQSFSDFLPIVLALLLVSNANAQLILENRVMEFGDWRTLTFEGNESFDSESIRDGLKQNPEFLLAAHPMADLDDYLRTLPELIRSGYLNKGFPDAQVSSSKEESGQVRVTISEGEQYLAGKVRIEGAEHFPVDEFIERLTKPYVNTIPAPDGEQEDEESNSLAATFSKLRKSPDEIIWEIDEPARFDNTTREVISVLVKEIAKEFGFMFANFKVEVVPNRDNRTGELVIQIIEEGLRSEVSEIGITGLSKNSRDDLLEYLNLMPGVFGDQALLARINQKLWDSARFLHYNVDLEQSSEAASDLVLRMRFKEYENAPPLSEDLSDLEQALIRSGKWLEGIPDRDEDLVIQLKGSLPASDRFSLEGDIDFVISPSGALISASLDFPTLETGRKATLIATKDKLFWFSKDGKSKFIKTLDNPKITSFLEMAPNPEEDAENPFNISFGAGMSGVMGATNEEEGFVKTTFSITPVAALSRAHGPSQSWKIENGILTFSEESLSVNIEEESGRLLLFRSSEIKNGSLSEIQLQLEKDRLVSALAMLEEEYRDVPNSYDPQHPLSSIVRFGASEFAVLWEILFQRSQNQAEDRKEALRVLGKTLDQGLLMALDEYLIQIPENSNEDFPIPLNAGTFLQPGANKNVMTAAAGYIFRYVDDLFPRSSWPWTISHEAISLLAGETEYTGPELQRLYESKETGPIGFWVLSKTLNNLQPQLRPRFAAQGLTRLDLESFQNDYRLLIEGNSPLAKTSFRTAEILRKMTPEEVKSLGTLFSDSLGAILNSLAEQLRKAPDRPISEALPEALDTLWENQWRGQMRTLLLEEL